MCQSGFIVSNCRLEFELMSFQCWEERCHRPEAGWQRSGFAVGHLDPNCSRCSELHMQVGEIGSETTAVDEPGGRARRPL